MWSDDLTNPESDTFMAMAQETLKVHFPRFCNTGENLLKHRDTFETLLEYHNTSRHF